MYWETPFHFKCNNPLTTRPSQAAFWLEVCPERHRLESNLVQIGNLGWDEVRTDVTCKLSNIRELFRCEQGSNLRGETPLDFKSNALTTRPSQPALCLGMCPAKT